MQRVSHSTFPLLASSGLRNRSLTAVCLPRWRRRSRAAFSFSHAISSAISRSPRPALQESSQPCRSDDENEKILPQPDRDKFSAKAEVGGSGPDASLLYPVWTAASGACGPPFGRGTIREVADPALGSETGVWILPGVASSAFRDLQRRWGWQLKGHLAQSAHNRGNPRGRRSICSNTLAAPAARSFSACPG